MNSLSEAYFPTQAHSGRTRKLFRANNKHGDRIKAMSGIKSTWWKGRC